MTKLTVSAAALNQMADSTERHAKESQTAWILCGQMEKYGEWMARANAIRRAAAEKSIWVRREILRNNGVAV